MTAAERIAHAKNLISITQNPTINSAPANWKWNAVENERFPSLVLVMEWFRLKITSVSDGNMYQFSVLQKSSEVREI